MRLSLAIAVAGWMALTPAGAQTKLTEFNGEWLGGGTDRNTPLASAQKTQCQTSVTADLTHLTSDMACKGEAGLNKRVRVSVAFTNSRFTGTAQQTSAAEGSRAAPERLDGTVTGNRNGDITTFDVRFPGLTPSARVLLELTSPTSYTMTVSTLGAILTKVDFHRPGGH
jgi:hypothetical protein